MAKRRLTPAGELGAADSVCGFAPKFHAEGNRDLAGNCSR
jgi:hypothetical protein